jgi:hypothetical protein
MIIPTGVSGYATERLRRKEEGRKSSKRRKEAGRGNNLLPLSPNMQPSSLVFRLERDIFLTFSKKSILFFLTSYFSSTLKISQFEKSRGNNGKGPRFTEVPVNGILENT